MISDKTTKMLASALYSCVHLLHKGERCSAAWAKRDEALTAYEKESVEPLKVTLTVPPILTGHEYVPDYMFGRNEVISALKEQGYEVVG